MTAKKNDLAQPASATPQRSSRMSFIATIFAVLAIVSSAIFAAAYVTAQESTPDSSGAPSGTPAATPSADMPRLELDLEELNDSGLTGIVTLYDAGERTIVEFDLEGAGGDHPANISVGVCGDLEPEPAHELELIDEDGQSLTTIDVTLDELLETEHAIDVRLAPNELGTLIACANIEGEPELPAASTPEATPGSTPDATGGETATETATVTPEVAPVETPVTTGTPADETGTEATPTSDDGTGGAINISSTSATLNLNEQSESGVTGKVVLTEQGNATNITLLLEGEAVTGGHIAHLHDGTCTAPGEYTYTLSPIEVDGTSVSVVNISLDALLTDGYFINVHPSEENWDAWMVCGELTTEVTAVLTPGETPTPAATTTATTSTSTTASTSVTPTPATTTTAGGTTDAPVTQSPTTTTSTTATTTQPVPQAPSAGDGTAGVTGASSDGTVSTLPQTAGVGSMLAWPTDPRSAILWATSIATVVLAAAAVIIRRGERHHTDHPSRWTRLGI